MRTSEERVNERHSVVKTMKNKKSRRGYVIKCAAACAACLAVAITGAFMVSSLSVIGPDSTPGVAAASIFTDHSALGYVVVAVISLCLGAFLTVFCFRIKKHNDDDGGEDKNDDRKH